VVTGGAGENSDVVTVGSQAPNVGGSLATINGSVNFQDGYPATLIVDDSSDTQGQRVTIDPPPPNDPADLFSSLTGLAPNSVTGAWRLMRYPAVHGKSHGWLNDCVIGIAKGRTSS
jgi:hypothetical protein